MNQIPLNLGAQGGYARDDFALSLANRDAFAQTAGATQWTAGTRLVIGPEASGKTHLLRIWADGAKAKVLSVADLDAVSPADLPLAIALDDAETVAAHAAHETALFHLYNHVNESGGRLLLTATRPVAEWNLTLPDLKSRLMTAAAAMLHPPDEALLAIVIAKLFSDRQIFVGQDVVHYILTRTERSFAAARAAVERIDAAALARKRAVTIPLVRDILF